MRRAFFGLIECLVVLFVCAEVEEVDDPENSSSSNSYASSRGTEVGLATGGEEEEEGVGESPEAADKVREDL